MNPVERIYAAFPMFMYLNSSIGGALLQPLLKMQVNRPGQTSAARDIGGDHPTVSSPSTQPQEGVEREYSRTLCYAVSGVIAVFVFLFFQSLGICSSWS